MQSHRPHPLFAEHACDASPVVGSYLLARPESLADWIERLPRNMSVVGRGKARSCRWSFDCLAVSLAVGFDRAHAAFQVAYIDRRLEVCVAATMFSPFKQVAERLGKVCKHGLLQ